MNIDFTINKNDLKELFIACGDSVKKGVTLLNWTHQVEASYEEYFEREIGLNSQPKTFSQWVNGQIIALT